MNKNCMKKHLKDLEELKTIKKHWEDRNSERNICRFEDCKKTSSIRKNKKEDGRKEEK